MNTKKTIAAVLLTVVAATSALASTALAWSPVLTSTPLTSKTIAEKGFVAFELNYNNDIRKILLDCDDIELDGFTGDVSIIYNGNRRIIVVADVCDSEGENRIRIKEGTAVSSDGKLANGITTETFIIK